MNAQQFGNRPAFPHAAMTEQVTLPTQHPGLSVREIFAKDLTAAWVVALATRFAEEEAADEAVRLGGYTADALLSALAESQP